MATAPSTPSPPTITLALWATNVAAPLADLGAWLATVEAQLVAAADAGADLLMLPEYACMQWLTFAPGDVRAYEEIAWMAGEAESAVVRLAEVARRRDVALLAGTMPARQGQDHVNRAHLFLPDGRHYCQDKLCLTPTEKDPDAWWLTPGDKLDVFIWQGLRTAIAVCLDVELPALATRLQPLDIDLILVPSMTSRLSGYHRVTACAKARAVELFTVVATVGTVGTVVRDGVAEPNVGGAAVFVPCEEALAATGEVARLDPMAEAQGPGEVLLARDIPVGRVRALRHGGAAEAWPGPWEAGHVQVRVC